MAGTNLKISICVVCMNRLHQLKQTLLQNINDCSDYTELEFVLLDYNSQDGMEDWVKDNLSTYIDNGRVVYYKTNEPQQWTPSHSKNLAFKLATGDIVCSIWADYYTGKGFPQYVNGSFKADNNIVLTPIDFHKTKKNYAPAGDVLGKVCVKKSDFLKVGGFDERMDKHGFEDYDFVNRLEMVGVKRVLIEDFEYLKYLAHDDSERFKLPTDDLEGLYINYLTPSRSEVLFLYKNCDFESGIVIDNFTNESDKPHRAYSAIKSHFEYSLKPPVWQKGTWNINGQNELSMCGPTAQITFQRNGDSLVCTTTNGKFHLQQNEDVVDGLLRFHHFIYTRTIMEDNLEKNLAVVNINGFGKTLVFKNFDNTAPLTIN